MNGVTKVKGTTMKVSMRNGVVNAGLGLLLTACGDEASSGSGRLQVIVAAEETIVEGLEPGDGDENIVDGWSVAFDKFLLSVGVFEAAQSGGGERLSESAVTVLDLTKLPSSGFTLADFTDVSATRYDRVSFGTPLPTSDAHRDSRVDESDFEAMVDGGYSHWVEGSATKGDVTKAFSWGISAPTAYSECGPEEGALGVVVPRGGTAQAELTMHGDHFFFDAFPEGVEHVSRRANWLVVADRDDDGTITLAELEESSAEELFSSDEYSLSGSIVPVENGLDWITAQAHTLGHFQGEGECVAAVASP